MEIKLKKASPYQWADLVASSSSASAAPPVAAPLPTAIAAPAAASDGGSKKAPRPYASHRDWEAVEKEITKELEGEKVGCGGLGWTGLDLNRSNAAF